jgi:hypothetical protein
VTHNTADITADIAAFLAELTKRTPAQYRTMENFVFAIERKFPGIDLDQLREAQRIARTELGWRQQ